MMSEEIKTKKPTHTAYIVQERLDSPKAQWYKAGAAWEHKDREGMTLSLNFLGQKVSVTVRKNKLRD